MAYSKITRSLRSLLYTPALTRGFPVPTKSVLLIIGGGIAAYKSLELVRRLAERGIRSRAILTGAGAQFVYAIQLADDVVLDVAAREKIEVGQPVGVRVTRPVPMVP
mgnify:CR=1 FL=1